MKKPYSILVTRELNDDQISLAEELELDVVIEPAIRIEYRHDWFAVETILKNTDQPIFAFTSQNGVIAFERFLKTRSGFSIPDPVYAVGTKTAEALSKIGIDTRVPKQQDGAGLAQKIVEDFTADPDLKDATVLHFCGDKRRDEFRQFLQDSDVDVRDVVVYKTHLNNMDIPKIPVKAILFFSPSAVQAYRNSGGFRNTQLPELFAIGSTTAEELSIETGKHVHISPEPCTEALLKFVKRILAEL
jgi:uroporphyrinogen-III synthase